MQDGGDGDSDSDGDGDGDGDGDRKVNVYYKKNKKRDFGFSVLLSAHVKKLSGLPYTGFITPLQISIVIFLSLHLCVMLKYTLFGV